MSKTLYRQEAESAEISPDSLVQTLTVTTPLTWLALLAMTVLLAGSLVAAYLIRVPVQVQGTGVVLGNFGELLLTVSAPAGGRLEKFMVRTNDTVKVGDVLVLIKRPDLQEKLRGLKQRSQDLAEKKKAILSIQKNTGKKEKQARLKQIEAIEEAIRDRLDQLKSLKPLEAKERKLRKQGYITEQNYRKTVDEINRVQEEISDKRAEKKNLAEAQVEQAAGNKRELVDLELQISQAKRDIAEGTEEINRTSKILSDHDGKIAEIDATIGDLLQPGQPLMRVLPNDDGETVKSTHNGIVYIPLAKGKQVHPGMEVLADLTTVRKELFGRVKAKVVSVSDVPATPDGIQRIFNDQSLSKTVLENGAVFAVKVKFIPDTSTPSGYKWTSGKGPNVTVTPGTSFAADITTERVRVISLIIPAVRGLLLGGDDF